MLLEGIQDGTLDSVVCQSGGLVPYSLAKALVKSANKGSKQAEKLHQIIKKNERANFSLSLFLSPAPGFTYEKCGCIIVPDEVRQL